MRSTSKRNANKHIVSSSIMAMRLTLAGTIVVGASLQPAYAQNVNFDPPKQIVGTPAEDAEPPQIAASGKNVYIIWHEFPTSTDMQSDVFFSRSSNRGTAFGPRMNLSNTAGIASDNERIAASGANVFVVWSENANEIFFKRSTNGGATFTAAKKLSNAGGALLPQIAAAGSNVFVAWQANGPASTDIFFTQSADAGIHFNVEKNISNNNIRISRRRTEADGSI